MTRSLYRRLEHLEQKMILEEEPQVIQVVLVASDGSREMGPRYEIPNFRANQGRGRVTYRPERWAPPRYR